MKLAIVGGSAPSTPQLFLSDAMQKVLPDLDVTLIGRSRERLAAVAHAIDQVRAEAGHTPRLASFEPEELRDALRDADVVLVQVRCGGYAGRAFDETFPLRYGICGDEGLGPGGLSAAWRSWPELVGVFDAIADACPHTRILLLTSPVSILVRCFRARYSALDVVGICELPWTTLQSVCASVGADPRDVSFEYAGVNHLGWFSAVKNGPRDVLGEFAAQRTAADGFPSRELIAACGGIPLKYLRLHYERDLVVFEQRAAAAPRGAELHAVQDAAIAAFAGGKRGDIEKALATRPAPWYEHAVGPFVASLAAPDESTRIPLFLSVPNGARLEGFEDSDILEVAHRVDGGSVVPIARSWALPSASRPLLESFVRYERSATQAVLMRDVDALCSSLAIHPWVRDEETAHSLAGDIAGGADAHATAAAASFK